MNGPPLRLDADTYRGSVQADGGRGIDGVVVKAEEETRVDLAAGS